MNDATPPTASLTLKYAPDVLRAALPSFGFDPQTPAELLSVSQNVAYRLHSPSGPQLVMRISRPSDHDVRVRESELAWLCDLKSNSSAPVPIVRRTADGRSLITVDPHGSGMDFQVCVFDSVPGTHPTDEEYATLMPQLGAITAELHAHATRWRPPPWFSRPRWDIAAAFGSNPSWGDWRAGVFDVAEREHLAGVEFIVKNRLLRFGQSSDRFGLIHADLRAANLLVQDGQCRLIDFDDCGFGWHLYDLATAMTFLEDHPQANQFIASWLDGYRSVRDLPHDHEQEIGTLLIYRRFLTLAFLGNNPDIEVSQEMLPGLARSTCDWSENVIRNLGK